MVLATSKTYGNYQTSIPKEIRKKFNINRDHVIEWDVQDGKPEINFRKKKT
ncbi:AbrB/MazE/SpoVT family DNA-binding domain-containing protein [uncultured Methanobrevibacter sp.]|uniref:AbrB/MazE/SpoVT family DNA-binding domain-containing protein n=1 Tax=uncultured Methanobrevibacter sp. TaxID=253161 RepID=UPI002608818D|nr:AbrB/MazE/SpoVT family DNA-binding domain-containing protein [uncultured Methanobrevibacter sp.]